jgi:hypothetical protein
MEWAQAYQPRARPVMLQADIVPDNIDNVELRFQLFDKIHAGIPCWRLSAAPRGGSFSLSSCLRLFVRCPGCFSCRPAVPVFCSLVTPFCSNQM